MTDKPVLTFEGWGVMPEHTPGPWTFSIIGNRILGKGFVVARIIKFAFPRNWEANARLIAAAPEMLAELEGVLFDNLPMHPDRIYTISQAIAKAKGVSSDR